MVTFAKKILDVIESLVALLHNLNIKIVYVFLQQNVEVREIWFGNYHSIFSLFSAPCYDQRVIARMKL